MKFEKMFSLIKMVNRRDSDTDLLPDTDGVLSLYPTLDMRDFGNIRTLSKIIGLDIEEASRVA